MHEFGELEHIKFHENYTNELNRHGCQYGKFINQSFDNFKKSMHSKIEDSQTVSKLAIDIVRKNKDDIGGLKIMVHDAINCSHASKKVVDDMETKTTAFVESMTEKTEKIMKDFDGMSRSLLWKLLGVVLGTNVLFLGAGVLLLVIKFKTGGR